MKLDDHDMITLLLAGVIKKYGTDNVLHIPETEIKNPFHVKLVTIGDDAIDLVLVEGQDHIDEWEKIGVKDETE